MPVQREISKIIPYSYIWPNLQKLTISDRVVMIHVKCYLRPPFSIAHTIPKLCASKREPPKTGMWQKQQFLLQGAFCQCSSIRTCMYVCICHVCTYVSLLNEVLHDWVCTCCPSIEHFQALDAFYDTLQRLDVQLVPDMHTMRSVVSYLSPEERESFQSKSYHRLICPRKKVCCSICLI